MKKMKSESENKVVDIKELLKNCQKQDTSSNIKKVYKNHTNPIMKKSFVISLRDNNIKFSVSDLFNN